MDIPAYEDDLRRVRVVFQRNDVLQCHRLLIADMDCEASYTEEVLSDPKTLEELEAQGFRPFKRSTQDNLFVDLTLDYDKVDFPRSALEEKLKGYRYAWTLASRSPLTMEVFIEQLADHVTRNSPK